MRIFNQFSTNNIRGDLFGGLSAAIVALPLGLAFGVASGAGPVAGVYSAILVGLFAAIFGGTPSQISGPTGPMTVVMTGILATHMASDPENGYLSAFSVVILAGLFQVGFGLLRLGKYIVQVSYPVISGFMSGIGVIIIALQLYPLVGRESPGSPGDILLHLPSVMESVDLPTLVLGLAMIVLLFAWRGRANEMVPGPVLVLLLGTLVVWLLPALASVPVLGAFPTGLPELSMPRLDSTLLVDELYTALLLAVLGSIDSLLTSLVADNVTQTQHDSDKELVGQGIGNMIAGLFHALPGAGATVRTVVNVKAGGRTGLSGVFHALLLVVLFLGAGPLAAHIPNVVLAAILIKVGVDIIDRRFLRKIHRIPLFSAGLMLAVLLLTVFVDLITAVFVGVFISNMVTVERLTNLQLDNVRLINQDQLPVTRGEFGRVLVLQLSGPMSFAVARGLNRRLAESGGTHDTLVIDLGEAHLVGVTSALTLLDVIEDEIAKGRRVLLAGIRKQEIERSFQRIGIYDLVPPESRLPDIDALSAGENA